MNKKVARQMEEDAMRNTAKLRKKERKKNPS